MRSEQTYNFEAGPYCLCCGSREVMTLDVYIAQSADWEAQSRLKDQRLWLSFSDLDEHELDAFVADVSAAVSFEDSDEFGSELYSHLSYCSTYAPAKYWSSGREDPLSIDEIDGCDASEFTQSRKLSFMRLWKCFDHKTKTSFLKWATRADKTAGSSN
jgi:hypothetical protein